MAGSTHVESFESLVYVDDVDEELNDCEGDDVQDDKIEDEDSDDSPGSSFEPSPKKMSGYNVYDMDTMRDIVDFRNSGKKKPLSVSSIKNRYRKVMDENHMNWIIRYVNAVISYRIVQEVIFGWRERERGLQNKQQGVNDQMGA